MSLWLCVCVCACACVLISVGAGILNRLFIFLSYPNTDEPRNHHPPTFRYWAYLLVADSSETELSFKSGSSAGLHCPECHFPGCHSLGKHLLFSVTVMRHGLASELYSSPENWDVQFSGAHGRETAEKAQKVLWTRTSQTLPLTRITCRCC